MAAPVAEKIILPLDTGNTGKKVRTQTRTVGADSVHEHFFIPISARKINGLYHAVAAQLAVQASAQNVTVTAHFWFQVPAAAGIRARIRRLMIETAQTATTTMPTAPRFALARFTFTGTPSGAIITPGKRSSLDATNVADVRTAVTGMTPTLGGLMLSGLIPGAPFLTSGGVFPWSQTDWNPDNEDEFIDVAPGEGVALYQPDAGTTADTRRMSCMLLWDEYDNT